MIDLYDPLYCYTYASTVYTAYKELTAEYKVNYDSDIVSNRADATDLYMRSCNLLATGGISFLLFSFLEEIVNVAGKSYVFWFIMSAYYGVQLAFDAYIIQNSFSFELNNHFDTFSYGYNIGRLTNAFMNGYSLYAIYAAAF